MEVALIRTKEEASAFAQKFQEEIAAIVKAHTVDGVSCGMNEQTIMQKVFLWNAGYLEGMRKSGLEIVASLGKLRPGMEYLLERETPDDIYEFYTDGFNFGIRTSDAHREESFERIGRMLAVADNPVTGHQEAKTEEVK